MKQIKNNFRYEALVKTVTKLEVKALKINIKKDTSHAAFCQQLRKAVIYTNVKTLILEANRLSPFNSTLNFE